MEEQPESASAETVLMPGGSSSPSVTSQSRLSRTVVHDEGRFIPGTLLGGRYRVIELLGRGGMGEVYRATDLMLGQSVALKFLPDEAASNDRLLERFQSEVRVARQVSHPNVCRVYDIGEIDGHPFLSMEFIDGEDLAALLKRIGRLPADKAIETARKICAGLAAAHDRGVIHRDLKPANIMMDRQGQVVIMDFGLAAITNQLSGPEARHGTPAYMAPEQLKGTEVTARSDIYSLGLVLYELFSGKRPFEASNVADLLRRQESMEMTSISALVPEVDAATEGVIRRCLDPDPLQRPSTALQVSSALPGGDPLAAALAAGETPSPELVAAAGATDAFPRKVSIPCLIAVLGVMLAIPAFLDQRLGLLLTPHPFPPDVLRQKARDAAVKLGYPEAPRDSHIHLLERSSMMRHVGSVMGQRNTETLRTWMAAESPLMAEYREAQELLEAPPYAEVSSTNPPPLKPGMVEVHLDGHGRLREFYAVPRETAAPAVDGVAAVFELAGLDPGRFAEVTPSGVPRQAADTYRAFRGEHPVIPKTPVTIEIAAWKGRVTMARFLWPWTDKPPPTTERNIRFWFTVLMAFCGLGFAIHLARRNWKLGRVDKTGAFRLAAFEFVVVMIDWFAEAHLVPSRSILGSTFSAAMDRLFPALLIWVVYLALEPAVRARWPHSIVTWNRLLTGRWRDSRVAGHVLTGMAVGAGLWVLIALQDFRPGEPPSGGGSFRVLSGPLGWLGSVCSTLSGGLQTGLIVFFLVIGLRALFRRDWLAVAGGALLLTFANGAGINQTVSAAWLAIYLVIFGAIVLMLLRLGLVSAIAAVVTLNLLGSLTIGLDPMTWFAPPQLMTLAMVGLLAVSAFRYSLGSRPAYN
jgi:predicted Ser/Thr protein kinase